MRPGTMVKNKRTLTATDDGGAEIDADEAFDQVIAAVDGVLEKAATVECEITHVAASCFWHSLVGVDAEGKATTKVFGWADTRSRERAAVLRKKLDESAVRNRTGARFHSSFWPAKLSWLRKADRTSFARTNKWLSLSDLIALRLTGTAATSVSMAWAPAFRHPQTGVGRGAAQISETETVNAAADLGRRCPDITLETEFAQRWPRLKMRNGFPRSAMGPRTTSEPDACIRAKAALMIARRGQCALPTRASRPKGSRPACGATA